MKLVLYIFLTTFKTLLSEEELQERSSLKEKLCRLRLIKVRLVQCEVSGFTKGFSDAVWL